ncbi:MAG: helix-turn-helix domain-containing protein [Bacteroidota bacterium]
MDQSLYSPSLPQSSLIGAGTLKQAVQAFERSLITESLKANNYDKRKVAKLLGISISSLYRKLSELSLDVDEVPENSELVK